MFGDKLREIRKARGYTLEALSDLYNEKYDAGLNKGTLSKYENNRQEPMISVVNNLALLLDVATDYLLGNNTETEDNSYYINEDARDIANFMFRNPEYKVLFDATKKVKKEDIEFVKQMIDRMGNTNDDTGC